MPWIFNGLYAVALIIASPWLIYRSISTGRYRQGWREKLLGRLPESVVSVRNAANADSPVIWLHGVSVGEVQLLKPLVEQLRKRLPSATLVLSTTTETGMELACKIMADVPRFYFPLDFTWSTRSVLQTIQPTMIVLGELELWPNLVNEAHARGIPIMVLNARLSEKSFVGYRRFRWLTEPMFAKLRLVAAQDATYADRFIRCGVPSDRVRITGCTKFDNVQFDNTIEPVQQLRNLVGLNDQHTVWIFGSTQSPEEQRAGEVFRQLRDQHPELRLIVVPRHPERFESVLEELQRMGLNPLRRTNVSSPVSGDSWKVLVVNTVGELRWWWGLADIAIVGGSFGSRGGQNMLEPAAYGANLAFGPNTSNFKDITEMLLREGGAERIESADEILPWIRKQLDDLPAGRKRGRIAQSIVRKHQGALACSVEELLQILESAQPKGQ